jgi:iron complex transport system ATP-binding protein
MLKAAKGEINVCGRPLGSMHATERAKIVSYVPQRGLASFAFSVEQVVAMGRHVLSRDQDAIESALSMCDLQHLRGRVYAELSVGQQQRVLLARAMAQSAGSGQVMLLDEPNSGMDLHYAHETMLHLRQMAEQGMCVLVVLQDISMAARYADDVWLLSKGSLVASGSWEEVLHPEILEPVYRVKVYRLANHVHDIHDRPLFFTEPVGTLTVS